MSQTKIRFGRIDQSRSSIRLNDIIFIDYYSEDSTGEGISDRLEINFNGRQLGADLSKMPVRAVSDLLLAFHKCGLRMNMMHEKV